MSTTQAPAAPTADAAPTGPQPDFSLPTEVNEEGLRVDELQFLSKLLAYLGSAERVKPSFVMGEFKVVADVSAKLEATLSNYDAKKSSSVGDDGKIPDFDETKGLRVNDLQTITTILDVCSKRNCFDIKQYPSIYECYTRLQGSIQRFRKIAEDDARRAEAEAQPRVQQLE